MRVIGEGDLSFKLLDISIESGGFIGSSAIIAHRPGISDELLYHYMLASEVMSKRSAVIFPFSHPMVLPLNNQPELVDFKAGGWSAKIQPGKLIRPQSSSDTLALKALIKIRQNILPRSTTDFPIIFVVDTLQKISPELDQELRTLIREAPMNNLSVWLHCPLTAIPPELFSIIGNVAVIWPSKREYDILKENLSSDQIEFEGEPRTRGMLFISNIITSGGKGWQFSPMEYDDLRTMETSGNDAE